MPKLTIPTHLTFEDEDKQFDLGHGAALLNEAGRYLTMAWALQLERRHTPEKNQRPFWLDHAINNLNKAIEALQLEVEPRDTDADPVDALFERANVIALGQVLR